MQQENLVLATGFFREGEGYFVALDGAVGGLAVDAHATGRDRRGSLRPAEITDQGNDAIEAFTGERGKNFIGSKESFLKAATESGVLESSPK